MSVGEQIASIRKERGYSIRQLAEMSGVNYANIGKIERGEYNASIGIIEKIAKALKCEIVIQTDRNMKATIKTYPTNAIVGYGEETFSIDYDFQGVFFDTDDEMNEWINEKLEPIRDAVNYDEIASSLSITLDRYKA